jgi:hypothetical protein
MSLINLNDSQYDVKVVKIFNNGVAGVANGCSIRVEKRKPTDADNAPLYKIILTDEAGAEINKGYFGNFEKSSDAALTFFVKEMKHLASLVGFELPGNVESYSDLLNVTMKGVNDNCTGKFVNVFVSYGTKDRPKKYLEIASSFSIVKSTDKPYENPKAQMTRLEPTAIIEESGNELPFGEPSSSDNAGAGW